MPIVPTPGGPGSPFRLNSLPQDAFAHPEWTRVEREALALVEKREHLLLLGRPGTGKSLLLRSLNQTLKGTGVSVRQLRSDDPLDDLASEDVLLVDEAELLATTKCDQILRLPNALVMAGLPNLPERVSVCPDTFRCVTLEPLSPADVARFVIARLVENNLPRDTFMPDALVALALRSGGLLRVVIILAGAAMFFAEQRGAAKVTAEDVADAESMRAVLPIELEQPATPREKIVDTEMSKGVVLGAPDTGPAWLDLIATRTRHPNRTVGISAFVCASLAVIGVAAFTALGITSEPSLPIQELQGSSMPRLVDSAVPDLALSPATQPIRSALVQIAAALPLIHPATTAPPDLAPTSTPETEPSAAPSSSFDQASATVETQTLKAPPSAIAGQAKTPASALTFTGPILNDTMGQSGQLSLQLRTRGAHGSVAAVFQASHGLIGSGVLTGDIQRDGQISLSGRLMMGRNSFNCVLEGNLEGERLVGVATFVRSSSGAAAHSSFRLSRL